MCCPSNKVIASDTKRFLALGGLHEGKLCGTLQSMAPTNIKTVQLTSSIHVESNLDRLGLLWPTPPDSAKAEGSSIVDEPGEG